MNRKTAKSYDLTHLAIHIEPILASERQQSWFNGEHEGILSHHGILEQTCPKIKLSLYIPHYGLTTYPIREWDKLHACAIDD